MAYIGNQPTTAAFLTDYFSGTGSQTAFTLSAAPAGNTSILVTVSGVLQDPFTYGVSGTTLTFSEAPPSGTSNISVRYLGLPASGVVTTAYRTVTEFTATAGQTTFTPPSYTPGFINVFRNGVRLGAANFTASNGTTVVLTNAASVGDLIVTESFLVSSVLNALPISGGTINSVSGATPLVVQSNGVTGLVQTSGAQIGVGTTTPNKGGVGRAVTLNTDSGGNIVEFCVADSRIGWVYGDNNLTALAAGGSRRISLQTNGEERLLIDSSGRVVLPYQPAFHAYAAGNPSFGADGSTSSPMGGTTFDATEFNVGSHYSTSTSRFTAPVAGRYLFTFVLTCNTDPGAVQEAKLFVNGVERRRVYYRAGGNIIQNEGTLVTAIFNLSAGDYVQAGAYTNNAFTLQGGQTAGTAHFSYFCGYLLG